MGTGIMMSEGDYDAATKTFTYTGEIEAIFGMKQKNREVVKIIHKTTTPLSGRRTAAGMR